jgi:hypothetical protein
MGTKHHYGFSRQYQVFAERYSTDFIFHDHDRAVDWILTRDHAAHKHQNQLGSEA